MHSPIDKVSFIRSYVPFSWSSSLRMQSQVHLSSSCWYRLVDPKVPLELVPSHSLSRLRYSTASCGQVAFWHNPGYWTTDLEGRWDRTWGHGGGGLCVPASSSRKGQCQLFIGKGHFWKLTLFGWVWDSRFSDASTWMPLCHMSQLNPWPWHKRPPWVRSSTLELDYT